MKTFTITARAHRRARAGHLLALWLACVGLPAGLLPNADAAGTKRVITDNGITAALESDLRLARGAGNQAVNVTTRQGIVTLSGSADNLLAKDRAVKVAETIRGVRGVIDQIVVTPVSRPDEDIRRDVLTALLQDPATEAYQIAVTVTDATITLTGSVGSWAESQVAAEIAKGVKGLKEIRNELTINHAAQRTDAEIAADIQDRLQWDVWLAGDPIQVKVEAGKAVLDGTVGSVLEQSRAWDDAWVAGTVSVEDKALKVDPEEVYDVRRIRQFLNKTDEQIKQAVLASFRYDPRLASCSPTVLVEDGTVILSGKVTHLAAKSAAGRDAKNTVGVLSVDNLLVVDPLANLPDDATTEKALRAALVWDPLLDRTQIKAAVIRHVAYLSGTVDSAAQRREAHDVASRVKGVELIQNQLQVVPNFTVYDYEDYYDWPFYEYHNEPRPYAFSENFGSRPLKSDQQIKKDIERAFFWSPFVHRNDISVKVDGGVAVLTGTVGSWVGYEESYRDTVKSGVATVIDRIKVKPGAWF